MMLDHSAGMIGIHHQYHSVNYQPYQQDSHSVQHQNVRMTEETPSGFADGTGLGSEHRADSQEGGQESHLKA